MDREQTKAIIRHIKTIYQNKFVIEDPKQTVDAWHDILKDYEFDIVSENLKNHIKTNKFTPVIADLVNPPKEDRERYIPTAEDTKRLLDEYEQKQKEVAADPKTQEERAKAREKINKMFGRG